MSTSRPSRAARTAPLTVQSLPMLLLRLRETILLQLRPIIRAHGITEQQARVLLALGEAGTLEMMALAETCCLASPSLSRIIPKLRRFGLVECVRHARDQRRVLATLSPRGLEVATGLRGALRGAHGETKRRIGEDRVRGIAEGVRDAIAALGSPSIARAPSAAAAGGRDADEGE